MKSAPRQTRAPGWWSISACLLTLLISAMRVEALDFASGADVSWLPQMEASGVKFKDAKGVQGDLLTIIHGMGFNAIRIRTWVNPSTSTCNGHCSQAETIALAVRVKNAGMRVMIDFHYGDTWNSEGTQNPPAAWASLSYADTKTALYNYTYNFCVALNSAGVTPEWISTGNEENSGICHPVGSISNPAQMTGLIMQGYTAIKAVFPTCNVVIHVAGPQNSSATTMLDDYQANGGQWDVTGFSSYASGSNVAGVQSVAAGWVTRYGKPVMQVEVGGQETDVSGTQSTCQTCINSLKTLGTDGRGAFYWEPETNLCSYTMNAWDSTSQQATAALTPFQNAATALTPIVPTNLTAISGNPQVSLSWSASASSANYNVKRATVSGGPYTTIINTTATSYSDTSVVNGTTYYYVVTGNNSIGESAVSAETNATPLAQPTYVIWQGDGVNNVWSANSNSNWANGSTSSTYVTGYNVTFNDTGSAAPAVNLSGALQPGSVTVSATKNYSFAGTGSLAGVMGLTKSGAGTLTLNNANTFTGATTLNGGVLQLANALALQSSTVGGSGGSLAFSGLTAATVGGLNGTQIFQLASTSAAPVALTVGNNNASTTFAGGLAGSGSLTKNGTGTLTLTGSSGYTGSTTVSTGTLEVPANGVLNSGSIYGAGYLIDGGTLTCSGTTSFAALNTAFLESSGVVNLASATASASDGFLLKITGGSFTATSLTLQRTAAMTTAPTVAAPLSASTTSGFYVNGTTANVTLGTVTVGSSNSSASARVDAGSVTVTGKLLLGHVTGGRWNILQLTGGTLTSTDTVDGIVCSPNNGTSSNDSELYLTGGTLTAEKIAFGTATDTVGGSSFLIVAGGTLYLGSGGILQANTAGLTSTIALSTGVLGAKADWSSTLPMQLTGGTGFTIKAANAAGTAHNIVLGGVLSGTGSLTKTGVGTLTLAANETYTGATTISTGTLLLNGSLNGTAVTVQAGGTLGGTGTITGNVAVNSGGTLATSASSFTIQGNLTNSGIVRFTGGALPQITGTFTNNGVLDIITGAQTLPGNFVNHGVVLNAGSVQTQAVTIGGNTMNVTIQSYTGHNYQLQSAGSLVNPAWQNVGSAQVGLTGTSLTLSDPAGLNGTGQFYRIVVSP